MSTLVRQPVPGIGEAVATSRMYRDSDENDWSNVGVRVAAGNVSIMGDPESPELRSEYEDLRDHISAARVLLSGRHLQHGDREQPGRNMEVFTNCSTASVSFGKFYLLLNGSGVGRDYSDDLMVVDWEYAPTLHLTLGRVSETTDFLTAGEMHPEAGRDDEPFLTHDEVVADLISRGEDYSTYVVEDSREGWAQALELIEYMTYVRHYKDCNLILDFSQVRPEGAPIGGMQDRPASGPLPLMRAIRDGVSAAKGSRLKPWLQTMIVDHHLAACVAVGGVRRAARIAVKWWGDEDIIDFINIKRERGLWSANNSVAVDAAFWMAVDRGLDARKVGAVLTNQEDQAIQVFEAIMEAQYLHATGEPGFLNVDRMNQNMEGFREAYKSYDPDFMGSDRYTVDYRTKRHLLSAITNIVRDRKYPFIVNPCGEIPLLVMGGYCVIADVVPFHCDTLDQVVDAMKVAARALVRVNRMDSLYDAEVKRTNRIGVGMTGMWEFAWKFFGLGFRDVLDEHGAGSEFWQFLKSARLAVTKDVEEYALRLGMVVPHTMFTMKPAGTTSKLYGLSEGAHLPARAEYLRYIQLTGKDMDQAQAYEAQGYPVRYNVKNVQGDHVADAIVGFPTRPTLINSGIPREKVVLAHEATMEEQFKWVRLLEKYWLGEEYGAQVSYTLNFDKNEVSFEEYQKIMLEHQPQVRAISLMPASDWRETKAFYGYVPQEPITPEEYEALVADLAINQEIVTDDELQCASGACPI